MLARTIYLHIGTHKTGTTSIQQVLQSHADSFRAEGIDIHTGMFLPANHVELHMATMDASRESPARKLLGIAASEELHEAVRSRLAAFIQESTCSRLVFSAEGMSYLRHQSELTRLAELFSGHEIKVIVYLREKQRFLESYRKELARGGTAPSEVRDHYAYTGNDSWLVDHKALISGFSQQFGAANLIIRDYDQEVMRHGSVLPSFLDAIGSQASGPRKHTPAWHNQSRTSANEAEIMRRHILISGTGRAGTTFLVKLLTALGLDTGFNLDKDQVDEYSHAGMEWDLADRNAPHIVKSPWLCEQLDSLMAGGNIRIEHLIIPVRDIYAAAESRRDVMRRNPGSAEASDIPGGLWGTEEPARQEQILMERLYQLIRTATRHDIPMTFLDFPRIIHDPEYLRQQLIPVFGRFTLRKRRFHKVFADISNPGLVHTFEPPG